MEQPPSLKELFHVAGNRPDPGGGNLRGVEAGYDLTGGALGHPQIWTPYRFPEGNPLILEADVFDDHVHLHCPLCLLAGREVGLRIRADAKAFQYEPLIEPAPFPSWTADQMKISFPQGLGGRLSVEPFRCTWESVPDLSRGFGLQNCAWNVRIVNNVVRFT